MENKVLEPTEQVTTTEKKTKPKDPGRIAAGKRQLREKRKEKRKRLAAKKKFQKKIKMKFQKKTIKKDHFH